MPIYYYFCRNCNKNVRKLLSVEPTGAPPCPTCNEKLDRNQQPASARITENYDNGLMARSVERLQDMEEIREEHGKADPHLSREIPLIKSEE